MLPRYNVVPTRFADSSEAFMQHLIVDAMKSGLSLEASFSVIDQMPFAIMIKDENLRFRAINQRFAALLPRSAEELIGMTTVELDPEKGPAFEVRERKVLATGVESSYHETLPNEHGVPRDYFTRVTRIDGGPAGMFVCISLSDVTDLNHARLRALQSDRLKSEFLANMSHEIRTPLNGVLGVAELLLHSGLTDQQASLAQIVRSSGVQLLRVIDDVLDFSHIEAGQMKLTASDCDLEEAIDDVVTLLSPKATEKGVELITHFRPSAPRQLYLDAARLRQILTNLVGNAIKFTDEGHILIDISVISRQLRIEVRDTGKGIPEKDRANIFKKFVRSDLQDGQLRGGAGLGLTISASLVRLMGGDIGVDSTPGEGSCFWFETPIKRPAPTATEKDVEIAILDRHDLRAEAIADRLVRWGYRPKRVTRDDLSAVTSAAIVGPDDRYAAKAISGVACILLRPLADANCKTEDGPHLRRASYPLRGAEVSPLLQQALAAKSG